MMMMMITIMKMVGGVVRGGPGRARVIGSESEFPVGGKGKKAHGFACLFSVCVAIFEIGLFPGLSSTFSLSV